MKAVIKMTNKKEIKTQALTDEKLEVMGILEQTALFTNGSVTDEGLPDGLYKYDLRERENISFSTIEKSVTVIPYGMVLNDKANKVELTYAGQEVEITKTDTSFYN